METPICLLPAAKGRREAKKLSKFRSVAGFIRRLSGPGKLDFQSQHIFGTEGAEVFASQKFSRERHSGPQIDDSERLRGFSAGRVATKVRHAQFDSAAEISVPPAIGLQCIC